MKKILLTILVVAFSFTLIACGGSNDSDLIGSWEREHNFGITTIVFNEDATGTWNLNTDNSYIFEWSTNNSILTKEYGDFDEKFVYEVDGNNLILIEYGMKMIYNRVE